MRILPAGFNSACVKALCHHHVAAVPLLVRHFSHVEMLSGLRLVCEGRRGESPTDKSFSQSSRREKATH